MTGCEVIAYKDGKIYLVKFRHDGYEVSQNYILNNPISFDVSPKENLTKLQEWWTAQQVNNVLDNSLKDVNPLGDELEENVQLFVWEKSFKKNIKNPEEFFSEAVSSYDEIQLDENALGRGYQCGYADYGVLIDYDTKKVYEFSGDGTEVIQESK